jgi:hypothetical protein
MPDPSYDRNFRQTGRGIVLSACPVRRRAQGARLCQVKASRSLALPGGPALSTVSRARQLDVVVSSINDSHPCRQCPRQDSNLRSRLRRAVLYPLSYGGRGRASTIPAAGGRRALKIATRKRQMSGFAQG